MNIVTLKFSLSLLDNMNVSGAKRVNFSDPSKSIPTSAHLVPTGNPDLPFPACNRSSVKQEQSSPLSGKITMQSDQRGPHSKIAVYPSPPPTGTQQSVPLPSPIIGQTGGLTPYLRWYSHGILDSPIIIEHEAFKGDALLSPPPTLPTSTLTLPPSEGMLVEDEHNHAESSSQGAMRSLSSPDRTDVSNPLLSPLYSVWDSNRISTISPPSSPEDCYLLSIKPSTYIIDGRHKEYNTMLHDDISYKGSTGRPPLPLLSIPGIFPGSESYYGPITGSSSDYDISPGTSGSSSPPSPQLMGDSDMFLREPFLDYPDPLDYDGGLLNSPSSPLLRSCSKLPDLELTDEDAISPPFSPGRQILSLPGADIDDDLIPADLAPSNYTSEPFHDNFQTTPFSSSLLFDEPNDVPPPRSPSPENFTVDPMVLADISDPDLQKLYDLRRKSQNAERVARAKELHLSDNERFAHAAAEARKTIKREKERCREVSSLLRLKLDEKGIKVGDSQSSPERSPQRIRAPKKPKVTNMSQLVANMILRRRDSRQMSNRRPPSLTHRQSRKSPLARSLSSTSLLSSDDQPDSDSKSEPDNEWGSGNTWSIFRPSWDVDLPESDRLPGL